MSQFDPETFLDSSVQQAGPEQMTLVPEGEYTAIIEELTSPRTVNRRDGTVGYVWDVPCRIDAPGDPKADARRVRYSVWLDLTDSGSLDFGENRNIKLGQLRAAVVKTKTAKTGTRECLSAKRYVSL